MFRKKVYHNCPRCFTRINPSKMIGTIGVCGACGWAGSYRSENYLQKVQFRVSLMLIAAGLVMIFGITQLSSHSKYKVSKSDVSNWLEAGSQAKRALVARDSNR